MTSSALRKIECFQLLRRMFGRKLDSGITKDEQSDRLESHGRFTLSNSEYWEDRS